MARSLPETTLPPHARGAGSALALTRLGDLRPYLLLALLTMLIFGAAYAARPLVRIDMGGDFDSVYLRGFNGREISAAGPSETYQWAGDAATIPGRRRGVLVAVLRAAPGQPADALRQAAVAVNDIRVDMPRRSADSIVAAIPPDLADDPELRISLVSPLVGDPPPPPGLVASVELAPARTYRWSTGASRIVLPNLGRGAWTLQLDMVAAHPDGSPLGAQISANDLTLATLPETAGPRRVSLLVPPEALRDGTLDLAISANTFADPRPLGIQISDVTVAPAASSGLATALPPLGGLGLALTIVLGTYASLAVVLGGRRQEPDSRRQEAGGRRQEPDSPRQEAGAGQSEAGGRRQEAGAGQPEAGGWGIPGYVWAALGVGLAAMLGGWALATHRFPSSFMLPRLAWLALWSLLLALALRPFLAWLFRSAGVPTDDRRPTTDERQRGDQSFVLRPSSFVLRPSSFLRLLLVIFLVGYWLKAVGMLYPYFVAIDVQWHMTRAQWILDGQLPLLYGTNSPLNDTTMPTAEWGANRPVIPYSPWYHIFATIFAFTPLPMALGANMWSLLIDSTRVLLIGLIARKAGLSPRAALIAAATFAVLPVSFLLHSWGNVPTTFGLWLTLVANTIIFGWWGRLHQRGPMLALTITLLLTFLIYTVTGVFMGVFLVVLSALIWLNGLRGGAWAALRPQLRPLWVAAGIAIGLALLIYYGQYIPPILATTVPYMSTVFTEGPQSVGVERPPFSQYIAGFIPHLDYRIWPGDYLFYGIGIPMLFTVPGFIALRRQPLAWSVFAAWLSVAVLFMLAGYRISMVDKQIFYMLPVMCVCWALYAERYWQRGRWGRLIVMAILLYSLVTALDQWVLRIVTSPVSG